MTSEKTNAPEIREPPAPLTRLCNHYGDSYPRHDLTGGFIFSF